MNKQIKVNLIKIKRKTKMNNFWKLTFRISKINNINNCINIKDFTQSIVIIILTINNNKFNKKIIMKKIAI